MSRSRSAEATIKGFNYQFDASIKLLLDADLHDEATVEGIEDIDVSDGNSVKAGRILREEVARAGMDHNNPTKESVVELVDYLIEAAGEGKEDQDQELLKAKHIEWNEMIEKI